MEWSSKYHPNLYNHPNLYTLNHSNGCGGKGQLCLTRTANFATSCTKMRNVVTSPRLMTHCLQFHCHETFNSEISNESIWRSKHETFKDDDSLKFGFGWYIWNPRDLTPSMATTKPPILKPTSVPKITPRCCATRRARLVAATRRGCVTRMLRFSFSSKSICGIPGNFWKRSKHETSTEPRSKSPGSLTFHEILVVFFWILIMVYYNPHITRQDSIPYVPVSTRFFSLLNCFGCKILEHQSSVSGPFIKRILEELNGNDVKKSQWCVNHGKKKVEIYTTNTSNVVATSQDSPSPSQQPWLLSIYHSL